jgi:hypothetical protein
MFDPDLFYDMDGNVISQEAWSQSLQLDSSRRVALTVIGDKKVSTVLLGIDHNYSDHGPPIIFESMVFGPGGIDLWCERYATKEEALEGHNRIVASIEDGTFLGYGSDEDIKGVME